VERSVLGKESEMKMCPVGDRVVVKVIEAEGVTPGGIVIPDVAKEKSQRGKVLAVGSGRVADATGITIPLSINEGDEVLFCRYTGVEVEISGEKAVVLKEEDVLAVIVE
jgi:chaperonin GroES